MGIASRWDGGNGFPGSVFRGMSPQKPQFLGKFFQIFTKKLRFSSISETKWTKSEEESEFGGRWFWLTWIHPPSQNLLVMPLKSKIILISTT